MNRLISVIILAALLFGSALAQELSGPLSGALGPGTYIVVGTIGVLAGDSLVIAPGTSFRFNGPYSFSVFGYLQAIGTATDSIEFIRHTGVTWEGIDFMNPTCNGSAMEYCLVNGSSCQGLSCQNGANPTIRHSTVSGNAAGSG